MIGSRKWGTLFATASCCIIITNIYIQLFYPPLFSHFEGYMLRLQRIFNGLNNAKTVHNFDTITGLRSTIIPIPTTNDRRLRPVTK